VHRVELLTALAALRDDPEPETVPEVHDRPHDGPGVGIAGDVDDEGSVDLEDVDRART